MSERVEHSGTRERSLGQPAERDLICAGQKMLPWSAKLLARLNAPLLTIACRSADPSQSVRLVPWNDRLEPGAELDPTTAPEWPEVTPLTAVAAPALRDVSLRWPAYARPPIIGFVTDGTGLAISAEHPAALSSRWLLDQMNGSSKASIILPFRENGVWALIAPAVATGSGTRRH